MWEDTLTQQLDDNGRSLGLWQVDAQEVDGNTGQGDRNSDQGVERVAVERNRHEEDGTQAEQHRVEQCELQRGPTRRTWGVGIRMSFTEDHM